MSDENSALRKDKFSGVRDRAAGRRQIFLPGLLSALIFTCLMAFSVALGDWAWAAPNKPVANQLPRPERVQVEGKERFKQSTNLQNERCRVALALGGGGCKSIADIGVLRAFEKNHIPIDFIVGTSAGATIGVLYASGVSVDELERLVEEGKIQKAMVPHVVPRVIATPLAKAWRTGRKKPYAGLTDGHKLLDFLSKRVPPTFNQLTIPYGCVATDLLSGDTVLIVNGDLPHAVLGSAALPPLVRPVEFEGKLLVDGGLKANLPANCAKLTHAELVVAVLTDAPITPMDKSKFVKLSTLAARVTDIMEAAIDIKHVKDSDVLIFPQVAETPMMTKDPIVVKETIIAGERAAQQVMPEIKRRLQENQVAKESTFRQDHQ